MAEARNATTQSFSEAQPSFKTEVPVRFADCDPAGIVFYPRFLEIFNNLVEDWCSAGLMFSFNDIVIKNGWGLPRRILRRTFLRHAAWARCLRRSILCARWVQARSMLTLCCVGRTRPIACAGKLHSC